MGEIGGAASTATGSSCISSTSIRDYVLMLVALCTCEVPLALSHVAASESVGGKLHQDC